MARSIFIKHAICLMLMRRSGVGGAAIFGAGSLLGTVAVFESKETLAPDLAPLCLPAPTPPISPLIRLAASFFARRHPSSYRVRRRKRHRP